MRNSPRRSFRILSAFGALAALGLLVTVPGCGIACYIILLLNLMMFGTFDVSSSFAAWFALNGGGFAGTDSLLPADGMVLEAKADGGSSIAQCSQAQTGPLDACLGISVHKPGKQLVYQSRAVLEVVRSGEVSSRHGLEARYASGGALLVQAIVDGTPVGSQVYLEETSAVLRVVEESAKTSYYVRPPQTPQGEPLWTLVHEDPTPPVAVPYKVAFGGHDLGEGSGFAFHALAVTGPSLENPAAQAAVEKIGLAALEFDRAEDALSGAEPDVDEANACAEAAMALLKEASGLVKSGDEDDAFDAGAKEGKAKKALKRSRSKTKVALKLGEKIGNGKSNNVKAMSKRISAARDRAKLAIANLFGSKSKKAKTAGVTLSISDSP